MKIVTIPIRSHAGTYHVVAGGSPAEALARARGNGPVVVIADAAVLRLHREAFEHAFDPGITILPVVATEQAKSYETVGPVLEKLLEAGVRRNTTLIAVGGGIIQDLAAFAATILMRGIAWRLVPTTLLSQCDSCIGAKSSINLGQHKNQLGTFHPPEEIHLSSGFLSTLGEEDIRSGLGEVVKFHLLAGPGPLTRLRNVLAQGLPEHFDDLILNSLSIKRPFIEEDEFDRGIRNLLNYGHTFGHAFEVTSGFSIPHGLAVALGMAAATFISERWGRCPQGHLHEVDEILRPLYRHHAAAVGHAPLAAILQAMGRDKKNRSDRQFVILTGGPGSMEKVQVDLQREIGPELARFQGWLLNMGPRSIPSP